MIKIGINGFGRIGKCIFLQLINNPKFKICAINATNISINEIEDYLRYDSTHKIDNSFTFEIISDNKFKINDHVITHLSDRNAKNLNWNCDYVIDATGSYLTTDKCSEHNAKYIIMTAPAKDKTNTFIYGANHELYNGEKIVSASSCTTNCLAPIIKLLNDTYGLNFCNFTTIHATTASQYTVDIVNKSSRTNRSILNNIIPHTTGASASITAVLPELTGKINGTSVRVPVMNCSLLVLDIELIDKDVRLKDIKELIKLHPLFNKVFQYNDKNLVSCDFITTTTPTIVDFKASIDIGDGRFKLMVWYDNEWSYSSQVIRIVEQMYNTNYINNIDSSNTFSVNSKYYYKNINMSNKGIELRLDLNVPKKNGKITDLLRVSSVIPTIHYIIKNKDVNYIVLTSHYGRPKEKNENESLKFLVPILEEFLDQYVYFLEDGISERSLEIIKSNKSKIYLLENLRFHKEETIFEKMMEEEINNNPIVKLYNQLGDIFILDAFGCCHRKHMSICPTNKVIGYGDLILKEVNELDKLVNCKGKILGIIGGNKINDKMPIIYSLRQLTNSTIFVTGGIAKEFKENYDNVIVMNDGYGNINLLESPRYYEDIKSIDKNEYIYDIGPKSLFILENLIKESDIIFWNGSLGLIEDPIYSYGSVYIANLLDNIQNKVVIIGGGETASLFKNINKNSKIYVSTGGGALLEYLQNQILFNKNIVGLETFK